MNKQIIGTAALLGLFAVVAGAFGAHGLSGKLSVSQLQVWHTAVEYQFYHVFALLFLAVLPVAPNNYIKTSYYLFTFGILFFSGSLYLLACRNLIGWNWLIVMGPVTPIGGLLFIIGWLMLLLAAVRDK